MAIQKVCRIVLLDDDDLAALPITNGFNALREPYQFSLTTKSTRQEFLDILTAVEADIAFVEILWAPHDAQIGLDEVHHLSLSAQAASLRALESGEFSRLNEHKTRRIDLRVLFATNVDLAVEARRVHFKADLYQRPPEAVISLPPLRERRDEIGPLMEHFLSTEDGGSYRMPPQAMALLGKDDWAEGNARELRNCIRAMTETPIGSELNVTSIPQWVWDRVAPQDTTQVVPAEEQPQLALIYPSGASFDDISLDLLRATVEEARLANLHMSLRDLVARLRMPKTTLVSQLKRAGMILTGKEAS